MAMTRTAEAMTADYAMRAISDRLIKDTCADLKARVMAIIEPEIDAACERAALSLKPQLEAWLHRDYARGHTEYVVNIRTEKRSPK